VSHLTKAETFLVIWLSIRLCPHTCANTSTPLVNFIINDVQVNGMSNMQKTLLQFITLV